MLATGVMGEWLSTTLESLANDGNGQGDESTGSSQ